MNSNVLSFGAVVLIAIAAGCGITGSGQPSPYLAGGLVLLTLSVASRK